MGRPALPDSSDPWVWVEWMLDCERDLFVRIELENPKLHSKQMTLVPIMQLKPDAWVYWTKRLFFDKTTPIRTYEEWRAWEKDKKLEPAAINPYDTPF